MCDFSQQHQMKFCEPTKGKSIRKLFTDKGYKLYLVHEYNTSRRLYGTGEELINFKRDIKRNKYVHRLLGSEILKSVDKKGVNYYKPLLDDLSDARYRPTIINRDLNGSLNISDKGSHIINGFDIPLYFKFRRKVDKKVKKMEKELLITINNLPKISQQKKVLITKKVSEVT